MTPRPRVVLVDGVPMSALVASVPEPKAVIVAIHGGATSAAYFDCPGRPELSLLRSAAANGSPAIAALFTASPRVVVNEMADSGHNLSVGWSASEYHRRVLSFVGECAAARETELEAG
jgi:hypothetical protein